MANLTTQRTGSWSTTNPATMPWTALTGSGPGGVPGDGDTITIGAGHTLTVDVASIVGRSAPAGPTTRPTVAVTGGGAAGGFLAAGIYSIAYTYVHSGIESNSLGSLSTFTVVAGNIPRATFPALPSGATSMNLYITTPSGSEATFTQYATGITATTYDLSVAAPAGQPAPPAPGITITTTGVLVLNGVKLTMKGSIVHTGVASSSVAPVQLNAGSTLEFDASGAPSPTNQNYHLGPNSSSSFFRIVSSGTEPSPCFIQSKTGGGNAWFSLRGSLTAAGLIDATYTTITRFGDATRNSFVYYFHTSTNLDFKLINCTLDTCGPISGTTTISGNAASIILTNTTFINSLGTSNISLGHGLADTPRTCSITNCVFDKIVTLSTCPTYLISGNIFAAGVTTTNVSTASMDDNFILPTSTNTIGKLTNSYVYLDGFNLNRCARSTGDPSYVMSDNIFDLKSGASNYIGITAGFASAGTITLRNNISLTSGVSAPVGLITPYSGATNISLVLENNTLKGYGVNGAGSGGQGFTGLISSFRGNLVWDTTARGYKINDGTNTSISNLVTSSNCNYNAGYNLLTGTNGKGYNQLEFSSGTPGDNDVDVNPYFKDSAVTMDTWDASLGGPGTASHAISQLKLMNDSSYDDRYTVSDLVAYIRNGMTPQNASLVGASFDGADIGALNVSNIGYLVTVPIPAESVPNGASDDYTLTLNSGVNPGTVTITPLMTGLAGTFSPTTIDLTDGARSATFTFTPTELGTGTLSFSNDGGLGNPTTSIFTSVYSAVPNLSIFETALKGVAGNGPSYYATNFASPASLGGLNFDNHYDPPYIFYNGLDYTRKKIAEGDSSWTSYLSIFQAAIDAGVYQLRDLYDAPNSGGASGFHAYNQGIARHYIETGDTRSRDVALLVGLNASYNNDATPTTGMVDQGLSRETAFAILNYLHSEDLGQAHRNRMETLVGLAKGHIAQWTDTPPGSRTSCTYARPFMMGLTLDALIQYWDRYRDASIPAYIKIAIDWMWSNAWLEGSLAFQYTDIDSATLDPACSGYNTGTTGAAPDLNLLIGPAYAWYYLYSGDASYRRKADKIFQGSSAGLNQVSTQKIYNQSYRWGFKYLDWRSQGDSPWADEISYTLTASSSSGRALAPSDRFIIRLVGTETRLASPVTVTPSDNGGGGSFAPSTAVFTTDRRKAIFRYTPASTGTKTISVSNDGELSNPPSVNYVVSGAASVATAVSLAYEGGAVVPNSPVIVTLGLGPNANSVPPSSANSNGGIVAVSITVPGNTISPTSGWLTADNPSMTFQFTPTTTGTKTVSINNSYGLTNSESLNISVVDEATSFTMTGPSASGVGTASEVFTVTLPEDTSIDSPVTVTPSDNGGNGVFTPSTVELSSSIISTTFVYTAASAGEKTISVTNNGGLSNPSSISLTVVVAAVGYTLTGPTPSSSLTTVASSVFTVSVSDTLLEDLVITPNDGGRSGVFTPNTVILTNDLTEATFTYTPHQWGPIRISVTNASGLANPSPVEYVGLVRDAQEGISPKITFRVRTRNDFTTDFPPLLDRANEAYQLSLATYYIPQHPTALRLGDTFTLYGAEAIQVKANHIGVPRSFLEIVSEE